MTMRGKLYGIEDALSTDKLFAKPEWWVAGFDLVHIVREDVLGSVREPDFQRASDAIQAWYDAVEKYLHKLNT